MNVLGSFKILSSSLRLCASAGNLCPQRRRDAERTLSTLTALLFAMSCLAVTAFSQDAAVTRQPLSNAPIDVSRYKLIKVYSNDFSKPQKVIFERDLIKQDVEGKWHRTAA